MLRNNPFDGDSYYAIFARIIYKHFISREWVTYADIMAEHLNHKSAEELTCNLSNCDNYGELKKAFSYIKRTIQEKLGKECFEEKGNNRNKSFRYTGEDNDPLADMRNAKVISDLKQYWQFCQDSSGFFPISWLEYFLRDSRDILNIKDRRKKGEQVLSASIDRMLTNIELLPFLYESIVEKKVLSIEYKPYEKEIRLLIFHPHYLKEYNGRWFLFGYVEEQVPNFGYNIALDRIVSKPKEVCNTTYIPAPAEYYHNFFKDIVGTSHIPNAKVEEIHVRAYTLYMFKLIETKKLHHSQQTIKPFGQYDDGEYGEFVVKIEVNNEFIGSILQMGSNLEIVAPKEVREIFKERVENLAKLYKESDT